MAENFSYTASKSLPNGIGATKFDRIFEIGCGIADPNRGLTAEKSAWYVFVNAWNGLAYRLIAAKSYSDAFRESLQNSSMQDRYVQDHSLFGFTISALSSIECAYMATYGLGAMLRLEHFPVAKENDLKKMPTDIVMSFQKFCPSSPLTKALAKISTSPSYEELCNLRNALSHRGALGRQSQLSTHQNLPQLIPANPKALAATFNYDIEFVPELTEKKLEWVTQSVSFIMDEISDFLAATKM